MFLQTPPLIMIRGMVKSEVQKASDKEQSSAKYWGSTDYINVVVLPLQDRFKKRTWRKTILLPAFRLE